MGTKVDTKWLPLSEAAQRLGMSWGRAWRKALTGELEARRIDGKWWCSAESVERLRRQRAAAGPDAA